MKAIMQVNRILVTAGLIVVGGSAYSQIEIIKPTETAPGNAKPIYVSMTGFTGEAAQVLQFDLYVQGFAFTNAEAAQYPHQRQQQRQPPGPGNRCRQQSTLVSKAYSGAALRRQAHAFADDFVQAVDQRRPIAQTKIAFKGESGRGSEIYIADFDGHNAQPVTRDNSIVAAPCWVPGRLALYYVSYKLNHAGHLLSRPLHRRAQGVRAVRRLEHQPGGLARRQQSGDDPEQRRLDGFVCLQRRRQRPQAPDQVAPGRVLALLVAGRQMDLLRGQGQGAPDAVQKYPLRGANPSASRPAACPALRSRIGRRTASGSRSPSQSGDFSICVVPANGGIATALVDGEDPSWSPNSRTLAYGRRQGGRYMLSLLDVPTKQYKDVSRISGISSQSQPSWAR